MEVLIKYRKPTGKKGIGLKGQHQKQELREERSLHMATKL